MPNGTVKFFNAQKGFGFITPDDGSKEVYVPAASVVASGITVLKPGSRVAFEMQPDSKGPKAIELKQIAAAHSTRVDKEKPPPAKTQADKPKLAVYLDPASELADDAVVELREAGFEPRLVDYIATPPTPVELKALSLLLRDSDQSLVRKFDPLFLELRLDDRFISDTEYWAAVHEHPSLINGPVLATATKARVCRTEGDVEAFVTAITAGRTAVAPDPKALPPSLLRLLTGGNALPAAAMKENAGGMPASDAMPKKKRDANRSAKASIKPKGKATPSAKPVTTPKLASKTKGKPKLQKKAAKQVKKKGVKKSRKK